MDLPGAPRSLLGPPRNRNNWHLFIELPASIQGSEFGDTTEEDYHTAEESDQDVDAVPYKETRGSLHLLIVRRGSRGSTVYTETESTRTVSSYNLDLLFEDADDVYGGLEELFRLPDEPQQQYSDDEMDMRIPTFSGITSSESVVTFLENFDLYAASKNLNADRS